MAMNHIITERIEQVHWVQRHEIMASWLQDMYSRVGFSSEAARLLIREQGLDIPNKLRALTDKNGNDICNVMRKPGSKNVNETPDRGQ